LKEKENNILNSGRIWHSKSLAPEVMRGFSLALQIDNNELWKAGGTLMSQSLTSSNLAVSVDDLVLSNADFSPIPNSIYVIK
jgi:hypothetical protein